VLLVLDQSSSVSSSLIATMKNVATGIADGIADRTHNRVRILPFAAKAGTPLETSSISSLPVTPPGRNGTNHADAFLRAQEALADGPVRNVIVMITDGKTTTGNVGNVNDVTEANNAAAAARSAGTTVFTVRLGSSSSTIDARMKGWATDATYFKPASPSPAAAIVGSIGPWVTTPAATNAVVTDVLDADFELVSSSAGDYDSGTHTLTWNVGTIGDEQKTLTYTVEHVGDATVGVQTKKVSDSVTYSSDQEAGVALDNPDVSVRPCGTILSPPKACPAGASCGLDPDLDPTTQGDTGIADLTLDAGAPGANTTLFLTKLADVPDGVCGGKFTNSFVQADVLPLTNKLVVTLYIPAPTSGPLIDIAKICLGTNLPFRTLGWGNAQPASDGLWYGILPYGPTYTKVNGTLVRSPSIKLSESNNVILIRGVSTRVTKIVFEVYAVGITGSDGHQGYDPRWGFGG
jgi:hypothetical protein